MEQLPFVELGWAMARLPNTSQMQSMCECSMQWRTTRMFADMIVMCDDNVIFKHTEQITPALINVILAKTNQRTPERLEATTIT